MMSAGRSSRRVQLRRMPKRQMAIRKLTAKIPKVPDALVHLRAASARRHLCVPTKVSHMRFEVRCLEMPKSASFTAPVLATSSAAFPFLAARLAFFGRGALSSRVEGRNRFPQYL